MNAMQRIFVNVQASFDQLVSRMENHGAVAEVAIQELDGILKAARGQLRRLQLEQERLVGRGQSARAEVDQWAQRARKVHAQDPQSALECVRRMKRAEREAATLDAQQATQVQLERDLAHKLQRTEERLVELRHKRTALVVKEAAVHAGEAVAHIDGSGTADALFDRWEVDLARREVSPEPESDSFQRQFEADEQEAELRRALEQLVGRPNA